MKFLKKMLFFVALFVIGSVSAKNLTKTSQAKLEAPTSQKTEVKTEDKKGQEQREAAKKKQEAATEGKSLVAELLEYPVPWLTGSEAQNKYEANISKLSTQQNESLVAAYEQKVKQQEEAQRLQGMLKSQTKLPLTEQEEAGPSLTFEGIKAGARERAKALWQLGGQKLQGTWEGLKGMGSRAWEGTLGSYGSSMGGYKYLLPGFLLASIPGALIGGASLAATALWGLGGSAAVLTVSSVLDRLNYAYETGGYMSTAAYVDDVKKAIALVLNNQAAYPYYTSKIEALNTRNEIYPIAKDKFGVADQAHTILLNEAQKAPKDEGKEKAFSSQVAKIRVEHGYKNKSNVNYISALEKGDVLINAQALVSEYNRAKNRKAIEDASQKQTPFELAKKMSSSPQSQPTAPITSPTTPPSGAPSGAPVATGQ